MNIAIRASGCVLAALLMAGCGPAAKADQRAFSDVLAEDGLGGVPAWTEAQPAGAEIAYLAGMSEALLAIEHVLQVRYATYSGELPLTPGGRTQLAHNPDAEFDPAFVEIAMTGALEHFARAEAALDGAVGEDFAVNVDLTDIWFDIDANGERGEGEDAAGQIGLLLGGDTGSTSLPDDMTVRFDTADADWLAAYVHAASASAELVLSVDPTSAIAEIFEGNEQLRELGAIRTDPFFGTRNQVDTIAVVLTALDGAPDAARTQAALGHFKQMIAHNQAFWARVVEETDNDKEWLPNAEQTSAFGVEVTAEAAENWQVVLGELAAVFEGRKLVPHWRVREGDGRSIGVNIESLLTDPGDFDLVLMLHGASLAPHMEEGELADMRAWRDFSRSVGGQGALFAFWLN